MARFHRIVFLFVLCAASVNRLLAISRPTSIVLENNEYKKILVAIDDNVDDDPTLVQKIKDTFTAASAFLYEATTHRAVFRDVTILVPSGWANNNAYSAAQTEVLNNADIIFTKASNAAPPPLEDEPVSEDIFPSAVRSGDSVEPASPAAEPSRFVHQPAMTKTYAGCGHQGVRIILTTEVLTNRRLVSTLGPPEKVLVHEWAHFRWGVFDEYGLEGEPQFYFSPTTGQLEGVRCTALIKGIVRRINPATNQIEYCRTIDPNTGLYAEGCEFKPYPAGPFVAGVEASIMDRVSIRPMSKFCDDKDNNSTRHNYDAPSRHNRLCGHRSTWDVISKSEDFVNNVNPARDGVDTTPVFNVVQAHTSRRLMLLLDTSASMSEDQKMTRMRQAVATFIQEGVAPNTEVGLTTFSENPQLKRVPQVLNTTHDRQRFTNDLPDTQSGATDITLALTSTAQILHSTDSPPIIQMTTDTPSTLLNSSTTSFHHAHADGSHARGSRQTTRGGHVVVVTDGQETMGSEVSTALPLLRRAGVTVSFVVLGGSPQAQLELLAQKTGGRIYYHINDYSSTTATDAFFDLLGSLGDASTTGPVQILSTAKRLSHQESLKGLVDVDYTLGRRTCFLVTYDDVLPEVRVQGPSGRVYNHIYSEYSHDSGLKMVKILIPGKAETGRWSYKITNTGSVQRISLLVLSSPHNNTVQPVRLSGLLLTNRHITPTMMHIVAEATRGQKAVKWLTVTALVNKADGSSDTVQLFDNGAGADIVEHDGLYSRFYSRMSMPGLYSVQLSATHGSAHQTGNGSTHVPNEFVERSAPAGHIFIDPSRAQATRGNGNDDQEAPVRISDLRVVKTSNMSRTVVLSWRASGDDIDRDTASYYEVYMAPTAKDLMKDTNYVISLSQKDVVHGNLLAPKPFGAREFYMLRIPYCPRFANQHSFVFTVVAVDKAGNKGEHSNYVTVGLGKVPDVTDNDYWNKNQFQAATTNLNAPQNQRLPIATVLGTTSALLVLVIIVSVIVYGFTQRKKDRKLSLPVHASVNGVEEKKKNVFALTVSMH